MEKPVHVDIDLDDKKTVVTIIRNDGRRLSMLNVIGALASLTRALSEESEFQMNKGNAQFFISSADGTLLGAVPFSSADKNQVTEKF